MRRIYVVDWSTQWPYVAAIEDVTDLDLTVTLWGDDPRVPAYDHMTVHIATDKEDGAHARTTHTFVKSEIVEEGAATLVRELIARHESGGGSR
jgi:hypothetical protein